MKANPDTARRILDLAEELLLTRGFNGFSYQNLSVALGVRNAAIHYHYPRKTDLGVALIQRYRRRFRRMIEAQAALPVPEQLERFFEVSESYHRRDGQICPSGILSSEYHTLPAEMQVEAAGFIDEMRDWSVAIAERGRAEGVFRYPGDPQAMGAMMFASLQGALQLARVGPDFLDVVKGQLRLALGQTSEGARDAERDDCP